MLSFCTRLIESRSLSEQHTPLEATSPVSTCSHRACVPGNACFSRFPFPSKGVWGPAPMLPIAFALQLCYTKSKLENQQFFRIEQGGKA